MYEIRHTHDFSPSTDLALKPLVECVFEGERPNRNNEGARAIDNWTKLLFFSSFFDLISAFKAAYAAYKTHIQTHDFTPSSDLALKPLVGCVFERERRCTNNERFRAINNM